MRSGFALVAQRTTVQLCSGNCLHAISFYAFFSYRNESFITEDFMTGSSETFTDGVMCLPPGVPHQ